MKNQVKALVIASVLVGGVSSYINLEPVVAAQTAPQSDYANHPSKDAINYVIEKKVMWKYTDGTFKPDTQMTQGQFLSSLVTVMQLKEKAPVDQVPAGHWAKDAYEKASKAGILKDVQINPNRPLTKEEASLLVNNAWKPYRGGIWPGVTNYQHLIARGILPKVWGQTPESPFLRSEGAVVFKFLHIEYNGIVAGRKIADQFHNSLKVANGLLTGTVPKPKTERVQGTIIKHDGTTINLTPGMAIKVKVNDVKRMVFIVFIPGKGESVASYAYDKFPKLERENLMTRLK